jgi:ubiquinone/menaquinone biosynthesis C-methylase UbiE
MEAQRNDMESIVAERELREIIAGNAKLRMVEPHIYSLSDEGENTNAYDRMGAVYDMVACSPVYNRLVWGYRTSAYHALCQEALASSAEGWVLDAGCGSLAFTAGTYAGFRSRPVVFLDQSVRLLGMAKSRLVRLTGEVPRNMAFLHADVLNLPFRLECFSTIMCLNVLHCLQDVPEALTQLKRVAKPGGPMFLTTLVRSNRLADRYLDMLGNAGALVPRTAEEVIAFFDECSIPITCQVEGSLAFLRSC